MDRNTDYDDNAINVNYRSILNCIAKILLGISVQYPPKKSERRSRLIY